MLQGYSSRGSHRHRPLHIAGYNVASFGPLSVRTAPNGHAAEGRAILMRSPVQSNEPSYPSITEDGQCLLLGEDVMNHAFGQCRSLEIFRSVGL